MLKQLKTLLMIADSGSFQAAARRLGITQSAVSMQVKALESELTVPLFDRAVRPSKLNHTGQLVLERVREIVRLSDNLLSVVASASPFEGTITIGTIPGASFVLPETLARLSQAYPALQVRVSSNLSSELLEQVRDESIDAGLVTMPQTLASGLTARPILREPLVVIAPRDAAVRSDVALLQRHRYIRYNQKAEVSRIIESELNKRQITVDPIMELDTLETFQQMIVKGLGVGILPLSSVRTHLREAFHIVPFGTPTPVHREVALVQRTRRPQQQLLDALYETFVQVAAEFHSAQSEISNRNN